MPTRWGGGTPRHALRNLGHRRQRIHFVCFDGYAAARLSADALQEGIVHVRYQIKDRVAKAYH